MVRIKHAPESALKLALHHQQQQQQPQLLQTQLPSQLLQPQHQTVQPQLHQSSLQSQQQPPQQLPQQLEVRRPGSPPGRPQIAFGHKADWDFSTGSRKAEGQLEGIANGKPVRLSGQALALLENADWGNLRTEVPVNRHVTLEHANTFAHQAVPSANAAERQPSPSKGRCSPDTAADRCQSPDMATGKLVNHNQSILQQVQSPSTVGQALGPAACSPRSVSPNSYLARSGKLNPGAVQLRSSSPLSRPGMVETLHSPSPDQLRTSSPPLRQATTGHMLAQSASHGKRTGCRGRPVLTWQKALEEVWKMDQAKPTFTQSLRTRSLSPQTQGLRGESVTVNQPVWQKYQRHSTPDRVSARPPPIRRGFHGPSRPASGRAFSKETPAAGPSGLTHVPNQAPSITSRPVAKKKLPHRASADMATAPLQAAPGVPWSPAGKALAPRASRAGKPLKALFPCSSGKDPSQAQQEGAPATGAGALLGQPCPSSARPAPSQPQPIRAGQQALAALLAKQAAWQQTRTTSLPPVLSQITALLRCNPEPILLPPARSAQELMVAADPQLGQQEWQSTTAVETPAKQWTLQPSAVVASDAIAIQTPPQDPQAASGEAAPSVNLTQSSSPAKTAQPVITTSSSSRSLKPGYRVNFAEQAQAALEFEAQQAKHSTARSRGNYFQGENYFQETAGSLKNEEEAGALSEAEEEALLNGVEEEEHPDVPEPLCDAGEPWRDPQSQ